MQRKAFLKNGLLASIAAAMPKQNLLALTPEIKNYFPTNKKAPLAIAMWDFSWLERRWDGAGYEDWDKALDELVERGYNAVRIDAFPHLVATDAAKEWYLKVLWTQTDWGAQAPCRVRVQPALNQFIAKCKKRKIKVGLSSWYREDADNVRMKITSPTIQAEQWIATLKTIEKDNLLDTILYVDLCNEWPGDLWAPYFKNDPPDKTWGWWQPKVSLDWMKDAIGVMRKAYPNLPYCFSFGFGGSHPEADVSFLDFQEPHIWLSGLNNSEYKNAIGYKSDLFLPESMNNVAANAERVYRNKPDYWNKLLVDRIKEIAAYSLKMDAPLITTECWGLLDTKDMPMFNWGFEKELCEVGVTTAAASGQWLAIASSNFCGPQFVGMWRDVAWHKRITKIIKTAAINPSLQKGNLYDRLA